MTFIPRAICSRCRVPFRVKKNDVSLLCLTDGQYYYSINADSWACPVCHFEIVLGFAQKPFHHNFDGIPRFDADMVVELSPRSDYDPDAH